MTEQELVAQIERAFADVPYPGDDRICKRVTEEAKLWQTEEAKIAAVFRGRHWREVPLEDLVRCDATLSFLTPEAYRFYLPAYLIAMLRLTPEQMDSVPRAGDTEQSLLFSLQPASDDPVLMDFTHHRIDPLTSDQKAAVRAFLQCWYERQLLAGYELFRSEKSVLAYWGYPEGHPLPPEQQMSEALPDVISGSRLSGAGEWEVDGPNCQLIQRLIWDRFIHVDQREDGWTKLYHDPTGGAYWELTYPHSHLHGGGPPRLTRLSVEQVQTLYHLPALERH